MDKDVYQIVWEKNVTGLAAAVNVQIEDGYTCLGGVSYDAEEGYPGYMQAMILKDDV